jgi:hypothetical protein
MNTSTGAVCWKESIIFATTNPLTVLFNSGICCDICNRVSERKTEIKLIPEIAVPVVVTTLV